MPPGEADNRPDDALKVDVLVDARGLSCPLPLLKARQALMVVDSGAVVLVLATDPAAERDFEDFAEESGHELTGVEREGDLLRITVVKA